MLPFRADDRAFQEVALQCWSAPVEPFWRRWRL